VSVTPRLAGAALGASLALVSMSVYAQTHTGGAAFMPAPTITRVQARSRLFYLDDAIARATVSVRIERYIHGGGMLALGAAGTSAVVGSGAVANAAEVSDRYMLDLAQSLVLGLEGAMLLGWQRDGQSLGERYRAMRTDTPEDLSRRIVLGEHALEHLAEEGAAVRRVTFVTGLLLAGLNVALFATGEDSGGEKVFNLVGAAAGVGMALWSQLHRTDAESLYRRYQRTTFREDAEARVAEDEDDDD
jgi:hypothetical protein